MVTPEPIGPLYYDEPRAVKVRDPENLDDIHSAVHGAISIYVDSVTEGHAIIEAWPQIMQAASDKAQEVLDGVREEVPVT
jgi:hypothetical protein